MKSQSGIKAIQDAWHVELALEKIPTFENTLSQRTRLHYQQLKFQQMKRRWGNSTGATTTPTLLGCPN